MRIVKINSTIPLLMTMSTGTDCVIYTYHILFILHFECCLSVNSQVCTVIFPSKQKS